jgi:aspartate-semialdehyde dehydrogenase
MAVARKKARRLEVALVGATGAVGREILALMQERNFPLETLRLLASERSVGERVELEDGSLRVERLEPRALEGLDLALFATPEAVSRDWVPRALEAGALAVDLSATFRLDERAILAAPELSRATLARAGARLYACPDALSLAVALALQPLEREAGLRRVTCVATLAVSGRGRPGVAELEQQVRDLFNFRPVAAACFSRPIAFNSLPVAGEFAPSGDTSAELGLRTEVRRLLGLPSLGLSATVVVVPLFAAHAAALHLVTERPLSPARARELLAAAGGLALVDEPEQGLFPTPTDAVGQDEVLVGRVRADEGGLALWLCVDNVRRGGALSAVMLVERLLAEGAFG